MFYLHRISVLQWLPQIFEDILIPQAVRNELDEGRRKGYDAPDIEAYQWLKIVNPHAMPSEWLALDLGPGELAAMAFALENPSHIVLLDDALARRTAQAAGLTTWGTLRILLEAKSRGLTDQITPYINHLGNSGMWLSEDIRRRILVLANEI
jgi:predicted nucleic acid-binding protein